MCEKERCDPKKIDWSQTMDQFFVELMLDEVRKGNKVGRTFKKKSWITMITCFNEKFGFQHGRAVLKNRYNVFRKHYSSVNSPLDQKGFTWDETQQKVVADDPVWNKYIQAHPSLHMDRNKVMSYYSDLCIIRGNDARFLKKFHQAAIELFTREPLKRSYPVHKAPALRRVWKR
ncbi:hypothetical protein ACFX2B_008606 [Malus domestica]